jgi:hypothetical protein
LDLFDFKTTTIAEKKEQQPFSKEGVRGREHVFIQALVRAIVDGSNAVKYQFLLRKRERKLGCVK